MKLDLIEREAILVAAFQNLYKARSPLYRISIRRGAAYNRCLIKIVTAEMRRYCAIARLAALAGVSQIRAKTVPTNEALSQLSQNGGSCG
jgi:hypothetical protein